MKYDRIMWIIATIFLLFGLLTIDIESAKWAFLGLSVYSIPLLLQLTRPFFIRYGALWFGIFLLVQTLSSPYIIDENYKTLPPNFYQLVDIKAGISGIQGLQLITTDNMGFRVTKKIDYDSKKNYRIFAIGGSTTEQIYLDDKKTWTHLLQERLCDYFNFEIEVINTGVAGIRVCHKLATLKKVIRHNPDLIIFLVGINDWNWHIKEHFKEGHTENKIRNKFLLRNTMIGKFLNTIKNAIIELEVRDKSNIIIDYGEYYTKQRGSLSRKKTFCYKPDAVVPEYKCIMNEISSVCHNSEVDCLFITQPTGYHIEASQEFKNGFWMTPPNCNYTLDFDSMTHITSLYNNYLIEFSKNNKHFFCDIVPGLDPSYDIFYDDCHFNEKGAIHVADLLFSCIMTVIKQKNAIITKSPDIHF